MANLFEGLESLGFTNLDEVKIYEKKEKIIESETIVEKIVTPDQFLYYKTMTCPICENTFNERMVRRSKLKLVTSDIDLKPIYEPIDPIIYDVIICKRCGYAAIGSFFDKIWGRAADAVTEKITPKYKSKDYAYVLSVDDAIERYKLALLNAIVKNAKHGEKAFICLKIGWLYRDKKDQTNEMLFLGHARDGFVEAFTRETMPICGISESTYMYLLGALFKITENPSEALKWLGKVIISSNATDRLKDRARDLKEDIFKETAKDSAKISPKNNKKGS